MIRIVCVLKWETHTHLNPQCSASHLQQEDECGGETQACVHVFPYLTCITGNLSQFLLLKNKIDKTTVDKIQQINAQTLSEKI